MGRGEGVSELIMAISLWCSVNGTGHGGGWTTKDLLEKKMSCQKEILNCIDEKMILHTQHKWRGCFLK
jgi:hypothetical protein